MSPPLLIAIGRRLAPELRALREELRRFAIVSSFGTTAELIAAWRLARRTAADALSPAAVVWWQSRAGQFAQQEVDAVQMLDPLARPIVVAGCWSEGETRSGCPLLDAARIAWHQGAAAVRELLARASPAKASAVWMAIHTACFVDYQGLAGLCHALGHSTIWQGDRGPAISGEPALRIFQGWPAWDAWQKNAQFKPSAALGVLLLDFPRPADQLRARDAGLMLLAQPFTAAALQRAIFQHSKTNEAAGLPVNTCRPAMAEISPHPRRRSA